MNFRTILFLSTFVVAAIASGQKQIYTKEGRPILNRSQLINNCLHSLNKERSDKTALAICECQTAVLDRRFTNKQYRQHTKNNIINLTTLVKEDSLAEKEIQNCYTASGQTILLQAESFEDQFLADCRESIQKNSEKTLDEGRINSFCQCQLQLVKSKRLTDEEMKTLSNPNSPLFFEMMYQCGSPFTGKEEAERNWAPSSSSYVKGPAADTIDVLNLNGMTYVKIKVGSSVQVWLFDTGASDLLINTETEAALKNENVLTAANYLGIGEYEMANGTIDSCRRYKIDGVQIGNFSVDNVVVSVSEKGKRIIVGKALLNKFRHWSLSNHDNKLLLVK
jgi:hypothetical protein